MTTTIRASMGVVVICAAIAPGTSMQNNSVEAGRLNPQIGPADIHRYKSIRDAKDWENPYLVIGPDFIDVKAKGLPAGGKTVTAVDLKGSLVELHVTAWPYGRVVGVQELGIRRADRSDDKPIADNLAATLATLESLGVTVTRWPS